jgi:hypothetical protein
MTRQTRGFMKRKIECYFSSEAFAQEAPKMKDYSIEAMVAWGDQLVVSWVTPPRIPGVRLGGAISSTTPAPSSQT